MRGCRPGTLNLKLPSRSLRQLETARQQPSYTYPGGEYDTFGTKMWQIYQGGDVKQIEEAAGQGPLVARRPAVGMSAYGAHV